MDERKPHPVIVEQLISDASTKALVHEINRTFANIAGRPAPDPESSLSPQPRPPRRILKGPRP
ncbi:MAG: hypothetical protein QHC89_28605 [Bosea sp. (in: a-proteobacteria)]|nr:hypothetical protein [Bosea sp. (in: a-proteobacteria)]